MNEALSIGSLVIDSSNPYIYLKGKEVMFTPHEYEALKLIAYNSKRGKLTSIEDIIERLYYHGNDNEPEDAYGCVKIFIHRLRKKLKGEYIETIWKYGYRLRG